MHKQFANTSESIGLAERMAGTRQQWYLFLGNPLPPIFILLPMWGVVYSSVLALCTPLCNDIALVTCACSELMHTSTGKGGQSFPHGASLRLC